MNKPVETKDAKPIEAGAIAALVQAQSTMGAALKKSNNPHFKSKYADLSAVQDACFDALHSAGFAVAQPSGRDDHGMYVDTIFLHTSGDKFESRVYLVVDKNNMQGVGSAITYARRYGLMGLAGIAPEDDDGNAAAKAPPKDQPPNHASEGIAQAWEDAVQDSLPVGAKPKQKAAAYAAAICRDMEKMKSLNGLDGVWAKRKKYIDTFSGNDDYSDFYEAVIDAYEITKQKITEKEPK